MSNLNVTYEEMVSAAGRLDSGRNDLTNQLNYLQNQIEHLVVGGFHTDAASVAFRDTSAQFTRNAQNAVNDLEKLSVFLKNAAHKIQATDQDLANSIRI